MFQDPDDPKSLKNAGKLDINRLRYVYNFKYKFEANWIQMGEICVFEEKEKYGRPKSKMTTKYLH